MQSGTRTADRFALWCMSLGTGFVILGGLIAAVTSPLNLEKGSWLAAYLVLVFGVPQYALGRIFPQQRSTRTSFAMLAVWNIGNAAVVAGTYLATPFITDAGGVLILIALVAALRLQLRARHNDSASSFHSILRWLLIIFTVILIVSIPVGLTLAHLRAG